MKNIRFIEARPGTEAATHMFSALWTRPQDMKTAVGIHGTIFYGLDFKKALYPSREERGMDPRAYSPSQRK